MNRLIVISITLSFFIFFGFTKNSTAQSTCPTLPSNTGSITFNTTIPSTANYKVWTRLKPSSTDLNANSLWLQFGTQCGIKVGDNTTAIPSGVWTWVDFQNGDINQKIILSLNSGSQSFKVIGSEIGVQIDKIMLLNGDDICIPSGVGDNCTIAATSTPTTTPPLATPTQSPTNTPTPTLTPTPIVSTDSIKPSINITNPLNNAIVQRRSNITISATALDNVSVDRVTFSVGGNTSSDYTSPYAYSWSIPGKPNAPYNITATAYDSSNNASTVSINVSSNK